MSMNQLGVFTNFLAGFCLVAPACVAVKALLDSTTEANPSRLIGLSLEDRGARLLVGQWCVLAVVIGVALMQSSYRAGNWSLLATAAAVVFVPGAILSLMVKGSFFSRMNLTANLVGLLSLVLTAKLGFPPEAAPGP